VVLVQNEGLWQQVEQLRLLRSSLEEALTEASPTEQTDLRRALLRVDKQIRNTEDILYDGRSLT
jgi:hypothetical protein